MKKTAVQIKHRGIEMKKLLIVLLFAVATISASAQGINWDKTRISSALPLCFQAPLTDSVTSASSTLNDVCIYRNSAGVLKITGNDLSTGQPLAGALGIYQGTTSVGITTTNYTQLIAAASDIAIPASSIAVASTKKHIRIHAQGIYTNAAASLLNAEVMLCTVSGCASGTVVAPAGCAITSTNQANNLTSGQWTLDCTLTSTATVGASGTFMAKGVASFNLGAATSAVQSAFADTATAVSAAVDQTVAEYVNVAFKFSTSNAGNSAIVHSLSVEFVN